MSVQWDEGTLTSDVGVSDTLGSTVAGESSDITAITPEYTHADIYVSCTSGTNFTEGDPYIDLYMRRRVSGSEEEDIDATTAPVYPAGHDAFLGQLRKVGAASGTASGIIRDVILPSNDFTVVGHNRHSAAYTACTIKFLPKRFTDV